MTCQTFFEKLSALRLEIEKAGFDGLLVPMADEYQNEYVPPCARRIEFLTGFTGSSAFVVVLKDKAAFFTDSRYTLQAAQQVSSDLYAVFDVETKMPSVWLEENAPRGGKIAYDPWLHTNEGIERIGKALAKVDATAVPVVRNIVDSVWANRPAAPLAPVRIQDAIYAGKNAADKRREIAGILANKGVCAAVISNPTSVAWLLNVRGADVENTPLPLSRAIIAADGSAQWFVDARKLTPPVTAHVGEAVAIRAPEDFAVAVEALASLGRPVLLDPAQTPVWIVERLRAAKGLMEFGDDPCVLPRAIKTAAELDGMRAAHRRDGASLVRFLAWLDANWNDGKMTEIAAAEKLESLRATNNLYRGPSFDTISAVGEHGAVVHYRATPQSDAKFMPGQMYLIDSGGQYLDGTTDVTRSVVLGEPLAEMRDRYTRVLRGHIAVSCVRFPDGTTGADIDVLARQHLWAVGLDYGHGTGHGVGSYLGVHEGPHAISKRNKTPLQPGMVVTNEPGYYKAGHYGVRIENVQAVVDVLGLGNGERKTYGFEPLTLAPYDCRLIDIAQLTEAEIKWIDAYHQRVKQVLLAMVDDTTAKWLDAATRPLAGWRS